MSEHPSRNELDELLGYRLEVLDDERTTTLRAHLLGCESCCAALVEIDEMLDQRLPRADTQPLPEPMPLRDRLIGSSITPLVVMTAALLLSAASGWFEVIGRAATGPLMVGAVVVVLWLRAVIGHVEKSWRATMSRKWRGLEPTDPVEGARLLEGVRISAVRSLIDARRKVSRVLVMALSVFIVAATVTLLAGVFAPGAAATAASARPLLLPGALAMGVLFGGVSWASLRLGRLARAVADHVDAATRELERVLEAAP